MDSFRKDDIYIDRPHPSAALLTLHCGMAILPLLALPYIPSSDYVPYFILFGPWFALWFLLAWAAVDTKYVLSATDLKVRSGIFRKTIALSEICGVERVSTNRRVLGWGPGRGVRGYCNRFRNGIRLYISTGGIYISPSEPETFASTLLSWTQRAQRPPK